MRAIKDISRDLTCRESVPLNNGRRYSPLELQKQYLELAHTYYSTRKMGALAADILQKWEYVLTKLAEEPLQLHREIDWVIKMHLLKTYGERSRMAVEARSDRLLMLDLQYHDIRREKGLYFLLERRGQIDRIVSGRRNRQGHGGPAAEHARQDARRTHQAGEEEAHPV